MWFSLHTAQDLHIDIQVFFPSSWAHSLSRGLHNPNNNVMVIPHTVIVPVCELRFLFQTPQAEAVWVDLPQYTFSLPHRWHGKGRSSRFIWKRFSHCHRIMDDEEADCLLSGRMHNQPTGLCRNSASSQVGRLPQQDPLATKRVEGPHYFLQYIGGAFQSLFTTIQFLHISQQLTPKHCFCCLMADERIRF